MRKGTINFQDLDLVAKRISQVKRREGGMDLCVMIRSNQRASQRREGPTWEERREVGGQNCKVADQIVGDQNP